MYVLEKSWYYNFIETPYENEEKRKIWFYSMVFLCTRETRGYISSKDVTENNIKSKAAQNTRNNTIDQSPVLVLDQERTLWSETNLAQIMYAAFSSEVHCCSYC